jgi:hypothetical protein
MCYSPVTKEGRSDSVRIAKKQFRIGVKCFSHASNGPLEKESKNLGGKYTCKK